MTEIVFYVLYTRVGEVGSAPTSCPHPHPIPHGPNHIRSSKETSLLRPFHSQYFPFHKLPNTPKSSTNTIDQIASPAGALMLTGSHNFSSAAIVLPSVQRG
jgi:hypothetical protein